VRSTPAGIDCGATCKSSFVANTDVSLSASAASGSSFDSWGGACSGSSGCTLKMSDDAQVFATFKKNAPAPPNTFRVTVAPAGTGTGKVTSSPAGIDCPTACAVDFNKGATVTLTAAAAAGSHFSGWSDACSGTGDCKVSAEASIGVKFDSDCDGLKPEPAGAALTFQTAPVTATTFVGCEPGTADGSGNLALSYATNPAPPTWHYSFLDPGGTVLGKADFQGLKTVIAQLAGYEGVVQQGSPILYQLGKDGKVLKAVTLKGASRGFNDPSGGVVVYEEDVTKHFQAYDASANLRWDVNFSPETGFNTLGVDRQGHVLVLFDGTSRYGAGTLAGFWIDHEGKNKGTVFRAVDGLSSTTGIELATRVNDGLFLSQNGKWLREFPSRGTSSQGAPDWLGQKAPTKLRMAHGGTAYALLPLDGSTASPCAQQIEIVAPSGASCVTLPFPIPGGGAAACTTGALEVGYDGTVLQLLPTTCGATCACKWQWYRGLLH
jgi:hypothetical protein